MADHSHCCDFDEEAAAAALARIAAMVDVVNVSAGVASYFPACADCWNPWPRRLTDERDECVYCIARSALETLDAAPDSEEYNQQERGTLA